MKASLLGLLGLLSLATGVRQQTPPLTTDYYAFMGVSRTASQAEITSRYRKLALKLHPDKNNRTDAEEDFKLLQEAYSVLSDDEKRAAYDAVQGRTDVQGSTPFEWPATGPVDTGRERMNNDRQAEWGYDNACGCRYALWQDRVLLSVHHPHLFRDGGVQARLSSGMVREPGSKNHERWLPLERCSGSCSLKKCKEGLLTGLRYENYLLAKSHWISKSDVAANIFDVRRSDFARDSFLNTAADCALYKRKNKTCNCMTYAAYADTSLAESAFKTFTCSYFRKDSVMAKLTGPDYMPLYREQKCDPESCNLELGLQGLNRIYTCKEQYEHFYTSR